MLKGSLQRLVDDGKAVARDAVFTVKGADRDYYPITVSHADPLVLRTVRIAATSRAMAHTAKSALPPKSTTPVRP
jgi:hypothetical protein